jgi:hypothetical protein
MPCDQSSLALDGRLRLEAGSRQGGCQPSRSLVLMEVAWLQLDKVDLARLPDALEVPASKHCPFAQIRAEVVDQHPPVDVTSLC